METRERVIDYYKRGCDPDYIAANVGLQPGEVDGHIASYLAGEIVERWLKTDDSQAKIAAQLEVPPSYVYKTVLASFSVEQRIARKSRVQRLVQTDERVCIPSWYTGPGRSVPLKVLEYCEAMEITALPPGMSVVLISQGVFALMTKAEAKAISQARSIIVGDIDEPDVSPQSRLDHPEQGYYQGALDELNL